MLRPRRPDDLPFCERLAEEVHAADGYPPRLTGGLRDFVSAAGAMAAWVAADANDTPIGHVVLNPRSSPDVLTLAARITGRPAGELAVVARLLVAPRERRKGIARSLLDVAVEEAHRRQLCPILDVATHFAAAIGLYESCGWTRIGQVTARIDDAEPLEEFVYSAPPPRTIALSRTT